MLQVFDRSLGLVGVGYWGKNLARNFHALGALKTICEADPEKRTLNQKLYPDVNVTDSFTELLNDPQITCVAIAAPAFQHYQLAREALLAGKDVFVEKPMCMTVQEAEDLNHLATSEQRILMVGHILNFHPGVRKLFDMVRGGELGKIQYITSNRLNLGAIRTEENALWNFAPHDISIILALCGYRLPDDVRCVGSECVSPGVADLSLTTLRFGADIRAHIYVSWLSPYKEQRLVVVGSSGLAVFDDTKPWGEKLLIYRNHVAFTQQGVPHINSSEMEQVQLVEKEPLREECLHFLTCCKERMIPITSGAEGLRVMKVLEAAQYSMNQGGETRGLLEDREAFLSLSPVT
jgi:UDP-2-acetamido-3-amino-2,3-dideoxy-glucuronate N-acetyltransferase